MSSHTCHRCSRQCEYTRFGAYQKWICDFCRESKTGSRIHCSDCRTDVCDSCQYRTRNQSAENKFTGSLYAHRIANLTTGWVRCDGCRQFMHEGQYFWRCMRCSGIAEDGQTVVGMRHTDYGGLQGKGYDLCLDCAKGSEHRGHPFTLYRFKKKTD